MPTSTGNPANLSKNASGDSIATALLTSQNANMDKINTLISGLQTATNTSAISGYQAIGSTTGQTQLTLDDFSMYLLIVTGVASSNTGYIGALSTTGGNAYKCDFMTGKNVTIGLTGLTLTVDSVNYVRINLIKLKTS